MSQKFLSSVALTGISNGSILKVNSSGEIVAAVAGTDYVSSATTSQWTTSGNNIYYNTGNVGIGESSPDGILHLKGSTQATEFYIESSTGTASTSGAIKIAQNNRSTESLAGEMVFYVQDNNAGGSFWREAMAIINNGNVGIGNSSPGSNRLKVTGATDITGTLTLSGYTAGLLKTNSSGTVSLDTNTYLTTSTASTTYLPLTGGTVANGNNASPLTIGRTSASALQVGVKFSANDGESAPSEVYFGMGTDGNPYWASTANLSAGNEIWHAGNDGASSGLDADLLDGNHASAFASSATFQTFGTANRGWLMPDYGGNASNFLRMYYEDGTNELRLYSYHGTTSGTANLALYDGSAYATVTPTKIGNWDTAYGWGNHASAGYITSLSGYATTTYVDTAVSNLVDSAPTALNTLNELAAALGDDASFSTTVSTALGNRLRLDSAVDYTTAEKSTGRSNLGLGSAATSATTDFAAASHNHDSRYYTETEVDTLLAGKASTDTATTSKNGLMSSTDKTKLDGIAANANNYSLPLGTSTTRGGFKIGYTETSKNYAVKLSSEQMYVTVPWTDTTYSTATSATAGLVKIGYTESGKNYPVELNASGQMYVNVPWVDTDTTYSEATESAAGLMSASMVTKLDGIADGAEVNVQADWNQTTTTADDYIKNKPSLSFLPLSGGTVDGTLYIDTDTGNQPFYITRSGASSQSVSIYVSDNMAVFESIQDENITSYGSFRFIGDGGAPNPVFEWNHGANNRATLDYGNGNFSVSGSLTDANGTINSAAYKAVTYFAEASHAHSGADITSGTISTARLDTDVATTNTTQTFSGDKTFTSDKFLKTNRRVASNQYYPLGHYTPGETVFEIDPTWTQNELRAFFNSNSVSWNADSTAPGGYCIYINGAVNVGGAYTSGFPYIPVDTNDIFYMECWIKNEGTNQGHYMGSIDYNESFGAPTSGSGNPGSYGYWVMSGYTGANSWTKVSGYISGFSNTETGKFETGTKYWTPQALFNYSAGSGTHACRISGWKVIKVNHVGNRTFAGDVNVVGTISQNGVDLGSAAFADKTDFATTDLATASENGLMSSSDKSKLDGIDSGANNYSLPLGTSTTRGGFKVGYTESGKNYPVELSNEQMYVNVPWTDTNTTYSTATSTTLGLVKIGYTENGKNYPVELSSGQMFVNVPWTDTNTTYSVATTTANGLMSSTDKSKLDGIAASANNYSLPLGTSTTRGGFKVGYTESGKNYPVELSNEQMYVNVPWTDTNTTYEIADSNTDGLLSSGDYDKFTTAFGWGDHAGLYASSTHNHNGTYTYYDHIRSLGSYYINDQGSNATCTTAQFITEIENGGAFDSYTSVFKTPWDYAGNNNISDGGTHGPGELAGMSFITWTDNSNDTTRGNITVLGIAPNTGGSAGGVYVWNDQGSGYAPGWREIWTSATDGSGSGLDADLLDGNHASDFATAAQGAKADSALQSIAANSIGAAELNVSGNGTTAQYLRSDADGTFTWATPTNTTYSTATSTTLGLVKIGYTENGKNYPVELSSGQMYVNVPWTDTDTTYNIADSGTDGLLSSGDYDKFVTAFGWGDHSSAGYLTSVPSALSVTSVAIGSTVTLSESTDRADLLYINSSTSSWGGLQIGNTSNEFIFSLMGNGSVGGIYDDQNSDWIIDWTENSGVRLYYNAGQRLETTSTGITISGEIVTTGGNSTDWQTAYGWGNHASAGYLTSVTNISGYSGTLIREDNRTISPSELTAGQMKFGFTSWGNNNTSPYADFIHLRSYTDSSGGSDNLVMFKKSGIGMRIWQQTYGSTSAYSSYADVYTTSDFATSDFVAVSGDTMTGALTASGGINGLTLSNGISGTNFNITGVNQLEIADPGEGIVWKSGASGDITLATIDDTTDNILNLSGTGAKFRTPIIQLNDANTVIQEGANNSVNITTGTGSIDIGSMNSSWVHIQADRDIYILPSSGGKVSVDGNLVPHTDNAKTLGASGNRWSTIYGVTGTFSGDVVAYSDARVKENIETIETPLDKVMKLRGVSFNRTGEERKSIGVIAQEIREVLPEVVHEQEDGMLAVAYGNIVGLLIEAMKEQQEQIDELKSMLDK